MGAIELTRRGLLDRTRALLAWSIGVVAYVALLAATFPSLEGSDEFDELVEDYPAALKDLFGLSDVSLTTGPGYMDTELFNLMLPLLVLVLAIGAGSRTLAGEEEAGRLELLLAYPLRRRSAVLTKGVAVAVEVAIVSAVAFGALAAFDGLVGLDLSLERLAGGILGLGLHGVLYAWLAIAVAAARPGRGLAIAIPAGVAAAGYLINGLQELASWLEPFRFVSSFWWIGQSPLSHGVDYERFVLVAAAALVALAAGSLLLERRDLEAP
ncbi:MAG TPA: ABC transporter permease subunit [Gaiellaceae bacterium]|jgi:ABC-2 type transport system permease protein